MTEPPPGLKPEGRRRLPAVLGLLGAATFAAGTLIPYAAPILPGEPPRVLVDLTPAVPVLTVRWLGPATAVILGAAAALALGTRTSRTAAGVLAGTGSFVLANFLQVVPRYWVVGPPLALAAGAAFWAAGGLLMLAAAASAPRGRTLGLASRRAPRTAATLLAGTALLVAGHLVPFAEATGPVGTSLTDVSLDRAIIPESLPDAVANAHTWGALLLLLFLVVALVAVRRAAGGTLGGLGVGTLSAIAILDAAGFVANLVLTVSFPAFEPRLGLFLGLAGAALTLTGAWAARPRLAAAAPPPGEAEATSAP